MHLADHLQLLALHLAHLLQGALGGGFLQFQGAGGAQFKQVVRAHVARELGDEAMDAVADGLIAATVLYFGLIPGLECEIGYWTHPDARGRGLMTRAFGIVLAHAFDVLAVRRVKALVAVDNLASRHLVEANGLRLYGVERLGAHTGEGPEDMALYDITVEEFRELG